MKVPSAIQKALKDRAKAADKFLCATAIVDDFLDAHNIQVDECMRGTGAEALGNPYSSVQSVLKSIQEHGE